MAKPAGVIVSGVVAILGSVLCLLMGALMLFVLPMAQAQAQAPGLPRGFMYLPVAMMLAFGAWGLISGIGLIGMRNWARISTLIFAGVLVTLAVMGLPMMFMLSSFTPPNPQMDANAMKAMQWIMALFYVAMGLAGTGWLIYFNRARVKEAFRGGAPEAPPNPNPLSIRIIGWYLVTSAPIMLLILLINPPAMIGGHVFSGPMAVAFYLLYGAAFFAAGVGLLKVRRWGHMLAMIIFALGIVNVTFFWLQPNARQQMEAATRSYMESLQVKPSGEQPTPNVDAQIGFGIFAGLLSSALPLYFLILRREKFLAAADAKSGDTVNPN